MAKLPFVEQEVLRRATSRQGIGLGANVNIDGGLTQAFGNVSNAIDEVGRKLAQKREKDKKLNQDVFLSKFANEEIVKQDDLVNVSSTPEDLNGVEQEYLSGLDERFQLLASDELGIEKDSDEMRELRLRYDISYGATNHRRLVSGIATKSSGFQEAAATEIADERTKAVIKNPELLSEYIEHPNPYENAQIDSERKKELFNSHKNSMVFSSASESISRTTTSSELAQLKSEVFDEEGIYYQNLNPETLQKLEFQFDKKLAGFKVKEDNLFGRYTKQLLSGRGVKDPSMQSLADTPEKQAQLALAENTIDNVNALKTLSAKERTEVVGKAMDDLKSGSVEMDAFQALSTRTLISANNAIEQQIKSDPFMYVLNTDEELGQRYSDALELINSNDEEDAAKASEIISDVHAQAIAEQRRQGVSPNDISIVEKDPQIINAFNAALLSNNENEVLKAVSNFQTIYKDNLEIAISNIGKDLPPSILGMVMTDDPAAMRLMAKNINVDDETLNKNVKSVQGNLGASVDTVINEELLYLQEALNSVNGNSIGGIEFASRQMEEVRRLTKLYMTQKMDVEKASKKAVDKIIGDEFVPLSNGSYIQVPKGENVNNVKRTVDLVLTNPSGFGINQIPLDEKQKKIFDEKSAKIRSDSIISGAGNASVLPDRSGIQFFVLGENGEKMLLTKDGEPFIIKFSEIESFSKVNDERISSMSILGQFTGVQ